MGPSELAEAQAAAQEHEREQAERDAKAALRDHIGSQMQTEGEAAWREYRQGLAAEAFAERAIALGSMTVRQGARRRGAGTPAGRRTARRSSPSGDDSEEPEQHPLVAGAAA